MDVEQRYGQSRASSTVAFLASCGGDCWSSTGRTPHDFGTGSWQLFFHNFVKSKKQYNCKMFLRKDKRKAKVDADDIFEKCGNDIYPWVKGLCRYSTAGGLK